LPAKTAERGIIHASDRTCGSAFRRAPGSGVGSAEGDRRIDSGQRGRGFPHSSLPELIDYNIANNAADGFSAHKTNYMLPFACSTNHDGRDGKEIKFQMSIKKRLLKFYGWAFYFSYTQKSFWQTYDFRESSPFRENNFNPEFFLRTKMWYGIRTDLGFEHESNGQTQATSRSWNRIYLTPYYESRRFIAFVKGWYRLKDRKSRGASDPGGAENPGRNTTAGAILG
jgi:phospholipase A1